MITFIGENTCKVDTKGRILLPMSFIKQLSQECNGRFVIKKDIYEKCLVLFPMDEWDRQNIYIKNNINPYDREQAMFLREYFKGAAEVVLDSANRLLIPTRLKELVDIDKEIVLAGQFGKIEIWSPKIYGSTNMEPNDFAKMAAKYLGGTINKNDGEVS